MADFFLCGYDTVFRILCGVGFKDTFPFGKCRFEYFSTPYNGFKHFKPKFLCDNLTSFCNLFCCTRIDIVQKNNDFFFQMTLLNEIIEVLQTEKFNLGN